MSKLALLHADQPSNVIREFLGSDPSQIAVIADLIRVVISAHSSCRRYYLIKQVCRIAAPAIALEEEYARDICDSLEREGDIICGKNGIIWATPLRIIDLGEGTFRFVSSLPTKRLAYIFAGDWNIQDTSRICQAEFPNLVKELAASTGGIVLSPMEWSRLDRIPPADLKWINMLDSRLKSPESRPGG